MQVNSLVLALVLVLVCTLGSVRVGGDSSKYRKKCGIGLLGGVTTESKVECEPKCESKRLKYSHVYYEEADGIYICCCKQKYLGPLHPLELL